MPNRIIREGILTSERVNSLSWEEEIFYRRLMSVVDDHGRFPAHPSILRAALYPLKLEAVRETNMERLLAACAKVRLVRLYEVSQKPYLQVEDFKQRVRAPSKYPPPSNDGQMAVTCPSHARLGEGGGGDVVEGESAREGAPALSPSPSDAEIPSEAEVIAFGDRNCIPSDYCQMFSAKKWESHTWITPHGRLKDWRRELIRWWSGDRATWKPNGKNGEKPPVKGRV